jgi:hydroxymethylglutaryl-CoA synthase
MTETNNFGIISVEYQLPSYYVEQDDVAAGTDCPPSKLRDGLMLHQMGVTARNEDVVSLAMSAVNRLLVRNNLAPADVGRLEVGTEGNFDASKSIKSYLMQLFPGNSSIMGCDTTHACYGGTSALFNAVAWLESSLWDGRLAIVVTTDIALYRDASAIPTCGAGAVAILLGPNAVYRIVSGSVVHYFSNEYDFMKPRSLFPFPVMEGRASVELYGKAFDTCMERLRERIGDSYEYVACHTPYPKLVVKTCLRHSIPSSKFEDSLCATRRNGNSYTSSLYFSLISLLSARRIAKGERILMFSYGAGAASSMFCLEKVGDKDCSVPDINERLDERRRISFSEFLHLLQNPIPPGKYIADEDFVFDGFYLREISDFARSYEYRSK